MQNEQNERVCFGCGFNVPCLHSIEVIVDPGVSWGGYACDDCHAKHPERVWHEWEEEKYSLYKLENCIFPFNFMLTERELVFLQQKGYDTNSKLFTQSICLRTKEEVETVMEFVALQNEPFYLYNFLYERVPKAAIKAVDFWKKSGIV